jgi:3-hydroxyisobutyrate dehydrogenase
MRVALLGTGILGRAVAERLQASGHVVSVYNRTPAHAETLRARGVSVAASPAEALRASDCALLCLADAAAIRSVLFTDETRSALRDRTIIQMGTIGPDESRDLATAVDADGGDYLEAPVLGSAPEAKSGALLIMVGARTGQMRRWDPLLRALCREPLLVGPVGQAAALKLALNQLIAAETSAFALSLALIQRTQVPLDAFMTVLKQSALFAPTFDKKLPRMRERRYEDPNFSTRHLLKDVDLVRTTAHRHGVRAEALEGIRVLLEQAIRNGYGDLDYSALYEVLIPQKSAGD